jgi:predicted MPP superfamily phosphohydrolase
MEGLAEILAERLAALSVDLYVFTGDYRFDVEGTCKRVYPRMKMIIGAVRSRLGIAGILGNHDCADIEVGLEGLGNSATSHPSQAVRASRCTRRTRASCSSAWTAAAKLPPWSFHISWLRTEIS